jgi:hypothetical protein
MRLTSVLLITPGFLVLAWGVALSWQTAAYSSSHSRWEDLSGLQINCHRYQWVGLLGSPQMLGLALPQHGVLGVVGTTLARNTYSPPIQLEKRTSHETPPPGGAALDPVFGRPLSLPRQVPCSKMLLACHMANQLPHKVPRGVLCYILPY